MPRSVGIIGYGNFGSFVHELLKRFAPDVSMRVFAPEKVVDGKLFVPLPEAAQSDVVMFAVPISAYEEVLTKTVPLMRKDAVIVDVATVKMHTTSLVKRLAAGRPYVATHPMFGPESYAKRGQNVEGFRIVIAEHTLSSETYNQLVSFLRALKFSIIEMSADEHDKNLSETLFLTHFVGQVITRAGFVRTDIDTVSFGFLMDAVESVRADKKLFEDVFKYNPHCKQVLERVHDAETHVQDSLKSTH